MNDWRRRLPFHIAAPSWVLPLETDNLVGNVSFLATKVDKVQLLCLGKDYVDELLNPGDLDRLADIRIQSGLRYSVHLPSDLNLLDPSDNSRSYECKLDLLRHIIELTRVLQPDNFILHLDPAPAAGTMPDGVLKDLAALLPGRPDRIQVENTGWDLALIAQAIEAAGLGICADFGHLFHHGQSIPDFLERHGPRIREIHLHGFDASGDHLALTRLSPGLLAPILAFLEGYRHSVTIENFRADCLQESLDCLHGLMPQ